jgi:hypothetical protein
MKKLSKGRRLLNALCDKCRHAFQERYGGYDIHISKGLRKKRKKVDYEGIITSFDHENLQAGGDVSAKRIYDKYK